MPKGKMICPNCKNTDYDFLDQYVEFCYRCGTKMEKAPENLRCKCGNRLLESHDFCTGCGLPREEAVKPNLTVGVIVPRSLSPLVCVHCARPFENHDFPCPGCGQDPRR